MDRRRNLGLASGSLWLVASSGGFAIASLLNVQSRGANTVLVAMLAIAVALIVSGLATRRAVARMQETALPQPPETRGVRKQFVTIVVLEVLAFIGVTTACVLTRQWALIAPLNIIVVGIHFLPLARLFKVPRYNITGIFFCGIPVAIMLLIPAERHVGSALSWLVIPSVACAIVAWVTAWAGLQEVRRFVISSGGASGGTRALALQS